MTAAQHTDRRALVLSDEALANLRLGCFRAAIGCALGPHGSDAASDEDVANEMGNICEWALRIEMWVMGGAKVGAVIIDRRDALAIDPAAAMPTDGP